MPATKSYETGTHQQPHFHARYGDYRASFTIDPPALLAGAMPRRQQHLVLAWAELHQEELLANWDRVAQEAPLARTTPTTLRGREARPYPGWPG